MNGQDCDQLTLFPADSPASHFPWLESKKVKGMTATCGLKCSELSESLRRVGYSVRTYLESCELPPGTWSRTWSARALTSRCLILKLRLSGRATGEKESRLLPTGEALKQQGLITEQEFKQLSQGNRIERHPGLIEWLMRYEQEFTKMVPTPRAQMYRTAPLDRFWGGTGYKHQLEELVEVTPWGRIGQLNPTWVEWLMGFPLGWTDLSASETP